MICLTCRELGRASLVFVTGTETDPRWTRKYRYYDKKGDGKEEGLPYLEKVISTTDYRCSKGHLFSKTYSA